VVIGLILIPPVLVKIGSTGYRFARYYTGDPAYLRKGPPPAVLRLLGPLVVVLTVVVLASGVGLLFVSGSWRSELMFVHRASFIAWFAVMTVHVLGHFIETTQLAPRDWYGRARGDVAGAGARQWILVSSIVVGLLLAVGIVAGLGVSDFRHPHDEGRAHALATTTGSPNCRPTSVPSRQTAVPKLPM
jgi:hypothetical protein